MNSISEDDIREAAPQILPRMRAHLKLPSVDRTQYLETDLVCRLEVARAGLTQEDLTLEALRRVDATTVVSNAHPEIAENLASWSTVEELLCAVAEDLLTQELRGPFLADSWCMRLRVEVALDAE